MSGKHWKFIGVESAYKGYTKSNGENPVAVYECPYCGGERRVPVGTKPLLRKCWNCYNLVDPEEPQTETEAKA